MPLPPERISVKRRRQEEPVDTLILDDGSVRNNKRHFTDFVFQRLRLDKTSPTATASKTIADEIVLSDTPLDGSSYGIPTIKATNPGDEVNDFTKYRASQATQKVSEPDQVDQPTKLDHIDSTLDYFSTQAKQARRFHLTRDISVLKPNASGGIRRRKLDLRPPLATFVERRRAPHISSPGSGYSSTPQDRILRTKNDANTEVTNQKLLPESIVDKTSVDTFIKPSRPQVKLGQSIRDDPSTWDHESDQLADELSKLAFELDPDSAQLLSESNLEPQAQPEIRDQRPLQPSLEHDTMNVDDEYVTDYYVRVRPDDGLTEGKLGLMADFGVLVIDEEDEDLWDRYVQSDGEDDWDEDDAEDNPRNDYPEDEVSTDDEYGHNVYQYRHDASGDDDSA